MIVHSARCLHCRTRAMMVPLLLVLISLVLPLETSQPLHVHEADSTGLYNQDHVFASLDSLSGDVPMPGLGLATFVPFVTPAHALTRTPRPSVPVQNLSDSRAPPLA
jgi:hypothetical protein